MPQIAPYGSWKSPITTEVMTAKTIGLMQASLDGNDVYWLESRPLEGGRNALVKAVPGAEPVECLPPEFNVRTRVHEYGGGAYAVFDGVIFFVNFKDQRLYRLTPGGAPEALTPAEGYRYADFALDRARNRLICVCEDHIGGGEPVNTLVAVPLSGGSSGEVLVSGFDFFSNPRLSPDGTQLCYLTWNHPNMPWDGTTLWVARIGEDGALGQSKPVAGGKAESIFQPEWSPEGVLHFVSDRTGWWNLYRLNGDEAEALYPAEAEFGMPQWVFGMRTYAFLGARELACAFTRNGLWTLARLEADRKALMPFDLPFTAFSDVCVGEGAVVFLAGSPEQPFGVWRFHPRSGALEALKLSFAPEIPRGYFSTPRPVEFPTENGQTAHALFYPPTNPDFRAPEGELPPLRVISHGGPTAATNAVLNYRIQYWTSRGFAVLDVNYGGSTGYGRAYRERLNGNWGIVDVDDCCNGARWLAEQGLVDGKRMAISGGSAGGFTTLAALVFKDVFAAGASHYGVSDLEALARDTHKFESRYLDSLVGPYPERRDLYLARSPIHHADRLSTPIILLQGDSDPVVPPNQSEAMFRAAKARGVPTAYLLFEGEQHGFRKAENIRRAFEAEFYFYAKIFGFSPADEIEPVEVSYQ
ncbi:MAG: S9 family peptidase [Anaerolineales bacterium]|nr:S9 family peptidase [Anaerolineales bacterium]